MVCVRLAPIAFLLDLPVNKRLGVTFKFVLLMEDKSIQICTLWLPQGCGCPCLRQNHDDVFLRLRVHDRVQSAFLAIIQFIWSM